MAASLFAVNKGFLDDIDVKKVLPFEHGLHQHLKTSHAGAAGQKLEGNRQGHGQGRRSRIDRRAIAAFKKSFA